MSTESVVQKLIQEQLALLTNVLKPLVIGGTRAPHVDYILNESDLGRMEADAEDRIAIANALSDYKDEKIASICQALHESHRVRRDVSITRANHKRLMAASVRTAYNKQTQLEYLAKGFGQKKDNQ